MKVAEIIKRRQAQWQELDQLADRMHSNRHKLDSDSAQRFSELYRSACADLALAEAYQLPPNTVDYLHRLVARSHNQLYRTQKFRWQDWYHVVFVETPIKIFRDPCVHICTAIFWGLFIVAAFLGYDQHAWPTFAQQVLGQEQLDAMEQMYVGFNSGRGFAGDSFMFGFYIFNNAGIGLKCFVSMLLVLPGLVTLAFNAVQLGTTFGYMFRPEMGDASANFQNFVTAHGPFELTAIVLSAGAGLKIGLGWVIPRGLNRLDSLVKAGREALPIAMCGVILFCLAAVIEGFVSAAPDNTLPWWSKGVIAVISSWLLLFYFVVLGFPERYGDGRRSDLL